MRAYDSWIGFAALALVGTIPAATAQDDTVCDMLADAGVDQVEDISFSSGQCFYVNASGNFVSILSEASELRELFSSMMFRVEPGEVPEVRNQSLACAVLEQTLALCLDGEYRLLDESQCAQDREANCERVQTRSCHPGAEFDCEPDTRHVLDLEAILDAANLEGSREQTAATETYCTGQVIGDVGYSLEVPADPVTWTCDDGDADEYGAVLEGLAEDLTHLMGWNQWDLDDENQCRYVKALVECVLPNLDPAAETCVAEREDGGAPHPTDRCTAENWPIYCGTRYFNFSDYCFRIVLTDGGVEGSPHDGGRAADFNNGTSTLETDTGTVTTYLGQWNSGTLGTVNNGRPAQLNLPPEFVSIMEGCGFIWGGRWFDARIAVEPYVEGCDPMHFELPPVGERQVGMTIDDTGSMAGLIEAVKVALTEFVDSLRQGFEPVWHLFTFKDNVTFRGETRDSDQIKALVSQLRASGGGDCPEQSLGAIRQTAERLALAPPEDTRDIVVVTDAESHPGDVDGLIAFAQEHDIRISTLLSGSCFGFGALDASGSQDQQSPEKAASVALKEIIPAPELYGRLAEETGGLFFFIPNGTSADYLEALEQIFDSLGEGPADTTPPTISVTLSPDRLWPPNHKMVTVTADVDAADDRDESPSVELVSIVSDEPEDGPGDGGTTDDVQGAQFGTDDRSFALRAERSGGGDGRVYTVTYRATDAAGNAAEASAIVTVPHNR